MTRMMPSIVEVDAVKALSPAMPMGLLFAI
jgi:hypothetical protein